MKTIGQIAYEAWAFGSTHGHLRDWDHVAREVLAEDARRRGSDPVVRIINQLRAAREWIADRVRDDDDQTLLDEIDQVLEGCGYATDR